MELSPPVGPDPIGGALPEAPTPPVAAGAPDEGALLIGLGPDGDPEPAVAERAA